MGLKHSGIRPSKEDIVGYRVSVANFFLENTPTVFCMEFVDATLINFVSGLCKPALRGRKAT